MLKTPSVSTSARPRRARGKRRLDRGRVAVRIVRECRARDAARVDERGVVQAVAEHQVAALHERGREAEVRHVAGGEEQRALATRECGQLLLECVVLARGR